MFLHIIPLGLASHYDLTDEMITTTWEYIEDAWFYYLFLISFFFYNFWQTQGAKMVCNCKYQRSKIIFAKREQKGIAFRCSSDTITQFVSSTSGTAFYTGTHQCLTLFV